MFWKYWKIQERWGTGLRKVQVIFSRVLAAFIIPHNMNAKAQSPSALLQSGDWLAPISTAQYLNLRRLFPSRTWQLRALSKQSPICHRAQEGRDTKPCWFCIQFSEGEGHPLLIREGKLSWPGVWQFLPIKHKPAGSQRCKRATALAAKWGSSSTEPTWANSQALDTQLTQQCHPSSFLLPQQWHPSSSLLPQQWHPSPFPGSQLGLLPAAGCFHWQQPQSAEGPGPFGEPRSPNSEVIQILQMLLEWSQLTHKQSTSREKAGVTAYLLCTEIWHRSVGKWMQSNRKILCQQYKMLCDFCVNASCLFSLKILSWLCLVPQCSAGKKNLNIYVLNERKWPLQVT